MDPFCAGVSRRLRRCRCDCGAAKTTRSPRRPGLDLVGRAHELHESCGSETPPGKSQPRDFQDETLRGGIHRPRAEPAPAFDPLPTDQARNAKGQFTLSDNQRKSKSAFARDTEKVAHQNITAFLHAKSSGNR